MRIKCNKVEHTQALVNISMKYCLGITKVTVNATHHFCVYLPYKTGNFLKIWKFFTLNNKQRTTNTMIRCLFDAYPKQRAARWKSSKFSENWKRNDNHLEANLQRVRRKNAHAACDATKREFVVVFVCFCRCFAATPIETWERCRVCMCVCKNAVGQCV